MTKNDGDKTTTYNYNGMNQLISMVENGVTTNFFYDPNGNLVQKQVGGSETWNYVYDYENRLIEVKKNSITVQRNWYDGDGKRIKKQENGETVVYIYSGIQVIYEKVIESGKETKYIGSIAKIEKVNGTETTTFYHVDHLGSTRAITDSTGNLLTTLQHDPFGEIRSGSSNGVRYTFTGKEQDGTGLYYYGARYYDPKVGRFITKDIIIGKIGNPQTQNRYSYVMNNPLKFVDPTGNDPPTPPTPPPSGDDTDLGSVAWESQNGSQITLHYKGGKTRVINLHNPKDAGWWAGYTHYGVLLQNPGLTRLQPGVATNNTPNYNDNYGLSYHIMDFEQAQTFAKEWLGLSPQDAREWAKGYIDGLKAAEKQCQSSDLADREAYVHIINAVGGIQGWQKMCVDSAWEIIKSYEIPHPVFWAIEALEWLYKAWKIHTGQFPCLNW